MPPQVSEQVAWADPKRRAPFRLGRRPRRAIDESERQIREGELGDRALRRDALYRRTLAAADVLAFGLALTLGLWALGTHGVTPWVLAMPPFMILFSKVVGLYDRDEHVLRKTTLDETPKLFQVATLTALVVSLAQHHFLVGHVSQWHIIVFWGLLLFGLVALRALARGIVRKLTPPERCVVLGDATSAHWLHAKCAASQAVEATIVGRIPLHPHDRTNGHLPVLGSVDDVGLALAGHDIERVIIAPGDQTSDQEDTLHAIRLVKALGGKVTVLPRLFEVVGSSVEFDDLDGATLLAVRRDRLTHSSRILKRSMDVIGSAACLLVLAPLFAIFAVAIKLTSRGPVFFRQPRIGERNREFEILKFRTMYEDADAHKEELRTLNEAEGLFKITNDPRCTSIGRFLRRTSLDELPQLLNVLRGQMSLVGPRPLVPDEDRQVEGWERRRLMVKPGMTGIWQILGSSRIPLDEMVKIDYLYGANWSIWLDIKVLLRTVPYVLARRGL